VLRHCREFREHWLHDHRWVIEQVRQESNLQPAVLETAALPVELRT
jgi:hypothetical protein